MNMAGAREMTEGLKQSCTNSEDREVLLFPGFLQVPVATEALNGTCIKVGGQNLYFESNGAYTGEVSAEQLKDAGCTHVLIGHSERRHYFHEDYETVNKKVIKALETGLKAMLCVGESLEERENNVTEMVVVDQLESAFQNVAEDKLGELYIAYEPIWAIGTGKTATPQDASHVHEIIRKTLKRIYSETAAQEMRILYGGSVKPDNIKALMAEDDIDGALVGGASLNIDSFQALVNFDK